MASEAKDSSTVRPESSSSSGSGSNDAGDFECNICFELAQDPVITLCGHLYCWPCLFRWLRLHSQLQECPVCKALIQEEKLIPLYGRGKMSTDPRSKPIPGLEIPNRPAGQRPETATPVAGPGTAPNFSFGFLGGFFPMATASFGNFGMSASFGAPIPPIFNMQFNGFSGGATHGASPLNPGGSAGLFQGNDAHRPRATPQEAQDDSNLKNIFLIIGVLVLALLMY
ncbi:ubiquitin-protein ligase [Lithospermum erythrorhizon]|uniref:E3 ubiquitin-protein ligase RMA n=1 Tax=Lithospermum erythrorhizon TaxID=34254 RepID=A0AAV3NP74_LITER